MGANIRDEIDSQSKTREQRFKERLVDERKLEEEKLKLKLAYAKKLKKDVKHLNEEELKTYHALVTKYEDKRNKREKQTQKERQAALKEDARILNEAGLKMASLAASLKAAGLGIGQGALNAVKSTLSATTRGVDDYLGSYSKYMTGIETRLQGTGKSFGGLTSLIGTQVGSSPYVRQTAVLENLSKLVEAGIVYNVEQRSFLASISDKIATTFNVANGTLLQLIRIQQADTTAARLGLEASLNKYFNEMFGDSSYLSQTFDTVSQSLMGATSQAGYKGGVELEFAAQKWLGSLGSVGVSQETLTSLASGLSSLATGNIAGLSGTSLEKLFLMSGLDYGSTLTGGLTAETTNDLLMNVVQTLQTAAKSGNQVVKAQYAQLFGVTLADLTAIMNLTSKDLVSISSNMLKYQGTLNVLEESISTIPDRLSLQSKIDNVFSNVMTGIGENIANNAASYTTWLVADMLKKSTGGIDVPIPFTGININIADTLKAGIVGVGLVQEIPNIINGLFKSKGLSMNNWGATDTTSRGTGFTSIRSTGSTVTTSQSTFIGSGSESDIRAGSIAQAKDQAQLVTSDEDDLLTIIKDDISVDVKSILGVLVDLRVDVRDIVRSL